MFEYGLDLLDIVVFLLTGAVAIYLIYHFNTRYKKDKKVHDIYYMVSFASLALACLLLVIFTFSVLDDALAEIIGALIPSALAMGLTAQFSQKLAKPVKYFALIGLVLIIVTSFVEPDYAGYFLLLVHLVSELIILVVPIVVVAKRKTSRAFITVAIGGLLLFICGLSLAMLSTGMLGLVTAYIATPLLLGLSLILFLISLLFAFGFVKDIKHQAT